MIISIVILSLFLTGSVLLNLKQSLKIVKLDEELLNNKLYIFNKEFDVSIKLLNNVYYHEKTDSIITLDQLDHIGEL